MTWYRIIQANTISSGFLIQSSMSCLGLNYRTLSGTQYTKSLVVYAGTIAFTDGTQVSSINLGTNSQVQFLPNNPNAAVFNALPASLPSVNSYQYSPLSTGTCIPNYQLNWVNGSSNAAVLPYHLVYPVCAHNNHQFPTLANAQAGTYMFAYGGYPSYTGPVQSTLYTTKNAFSSRAYPASSLASTVSTNWGGLGAITANGTFIIYSGRVTTSASSLSSTVHTSFDNGQTWSVSTTTATASARYETPMLSIPRTNWLVIIGGYNSGGSETNQVYLSTDGLGAVWSLQTSASPVPTSALATAVALCDSSFCNPSLYSTPNSTLIFFLEYNDGAYFFSYDLGRTWSVPYSYPFASALDDTTHRDWLTATADTDNNVYFAGMYNDPDPRVWLSITKGQTWAPLVQSVSFPGLSNSLQFQYTAYNCMGFTYNPQTLAKRLVMFAYETLFSDGSAYESVYGDMNIPNNVTGYGLLPNSTFAVATQSGTLPAVSYPVCSYNLHSLTSSPLFFTLCNQGAQSNCSPSRRATFTISAALRQPISLSCSFGILVRFSWIAMR